MSFVKHMCFPRLISLSLLLAGGTHVFAGNDGYFTTYSHHIKRGEKELMLMNDFTRPSQPHQADGQKDYASQMVEFEWNVTDRFVSELMIESFADSGGEKRFTGFRWENRFRLFKDEVFLNPMVYMEYEHLKRATRYKMETSGWIDAPYLEPAGESLDPNADERIMETRVVLSEDFGPTNVAFNWINETDLKRGRTDFGYSFGVMYNVGSDTHEGHHGHGGTHREGLFSGFRFAGLGAELFGGLGDDRKLDVRLKRQEHYAGPVAMLHLSEDLMLHIGVAAGLSRSSDKILVRLALGFEF